MIYTKTPATGALVGDVFWFGQYGINRISPAIIITDDYFVQKNIDCDVIDTSEPQNLLKEKNCKHFAAEGNITLVNADGCKRSEKIPSLGLPVSDYKAGRVTVDRWSGRTSGGKQVNVYPFLITRRGEDARTTYRTYMPNDATVKTDLCVSWQGASRFCVSFDTYMADNLPLWRARGFKSLEQSISSLGTRNAIAIRSHYWRSFTFSLENENDSKWTLVGRREDDNDYIHWNIGSYNEHYTGDADYSPCITAPFTTSVAYWANQRRKVSFDTAPVILQSGAIPRKEYSWTLFAALENAYDQYALDDAGNSVWSHMMSDALDSMRVLDQNLAMTLVEWSRLKSDLTEYLRSVEKLPSTLRSKSIGSLQKAKDTASVYLGGKYGYGLTFQEAVDMGERLASFTSDPSKALGRTRAKRREHFPDVNTVNHLGSGIDLTLNYGITVKSLPNAFSEAYNKLRKFSAWITLKDAWDFIPYSFVIDWFVDVSQVLDGVDTKAETANLQLLSCVKSYKMLGSLNVALAYPWLSKYLLQGDATVVRFKQYSRWCESGFDQPPLLPSTGSFPEIFSRHWPEATALIIQRL